MIRKVLVGVIASMKIKYGYTYLKGTAHKPVASLSQTLKKYGIIWSRNSQLPIQKHTTGVMKKTSFPSVPLVTKSSGYQGKECTCLWKSPNSLWSSSDSPRFPWEEKRNKTRSRSSQSANETTHEHASPGVLVKHKGGHDAQSVAAQLNVAFSRCSNYSQLQIHLPKTT